MSRALSIGVYGFTEGAFFAALAGAGARALFDVRARRGVRGSLYPWANARRLEAACAERCIEYRWARELTPEPELRRMLAARDRAEGRGQRTRLTLSEEYVRGYEASVLDGKDLGWLAEALRACEPAALMCLESSPQACHRSLIARRLEEVSGARFVHLSPE